MGHDVLLVAAEPAGAVVGFCALHPGDGELYLLFVDPAQTGQGVGRALLRAGHEVLHAAGCSQAFLFTQATNDRARAVYTAAGYRPDDQTRTSEFRGRSVPEVRMTVDLERRDNHRC
jgi:ribosomal protein S18 acetylase RimI-like enzyme